MGSTLTLNCSTILYPCVNCTRVQHEPYFSENDIYVKYALYNGHNVTYRWFGIPHPSNVHLTEDMTVLSWKIQQDPTARGNLVALWASHHVQNKRATRIRKKLHLDCEMYPTKCYVENIKNRYDQTQMNTGTSIERVYGNATFCLMPPGDTPTRKGIFDSVLMGCIPVFFDNHLLSYKYEWWFTKELDEQCAVYITGDTYALNVVEVLEKISAATIREKQQCLEGIAPSLSYAVPPARFQPYIGFGGGKSR